MVLVRVLLIVSDISCTNAEIRIKTEKDGELFSADCPTQVWLWPNSDSFSLYSYEPILQLVASTEWKTLKYIAGVSQ